MELQKRKPLRMKGYDYSLPGLYFITVCTDNKKALFSRIVGAYHDAPVETILTPYGKMVEEAIEELPKRFKLNVEKYVIMPDHIHLLIELTDYERYEGSERAIRESPLQNRSIIAQSIGFLKAEATKKIHKAAPNLKIWQRSFHDHIVRGEKDYSKH